MLHLFEQRGSYSAPSLASSPTKPVKKKSKKLSTGTIVAIVIGGFALGFNERFGKHTIPILLFDAPMHYFVSGAPWTNPPKIALVSDDFVHEIMAWQGLFNQVPQQPNPMPMMAPTHPPHHHHHHHHHHQAPSPMPIVYKSSLPSPPAVDFSPPLIAMVVVVAAAFVMVTYSRLLSRHLKPPIQRLIRRFRRRRFLPPSSLGDVESLQYESTLDGLHVFSPYGLDESVIKTIPSCLYTAKYQESRRDCAVCLLEFEDDDYVRTLPVCSHTFHVDCIDAWLCSHANCPLCRAGVLCFDSPFTPLMAARIRPSFDDYAILHHVDMNFDATPSRSVVPEITPCVDDHSPGRNNVAVVSEDRFNVGDFLLKRSYSFGFERSLPSERMVMDAATASPWRYRKGSTGFWSKRPSPFGSMGKSRVFSFRYYRGMKSPFFRRRGFFPLSESSVRYAGGGSSSRRSKSITSPMFLRSSAAAAAFSSSRLRCGDPEALLSPERFNRR